MDGPGVRLASRQRMLWTAAAVLVFVAGLSALFAPMWGADARQVVPWPALAPGVDADPLERLVPLPDALRDARRKVARSDQIFAVWLLGDGARALLTHPLHPFRTEPCHPADNARALGHPAFTQALLGAPAWLVTRDPVATFNFALVASVAIGALAMFGLLRAWTAEPAAGIGAGLLYAFGASKLGIAAYPFLFDTSWTVLALWLTVRAVAGGRGRDAVLAGLCCALQIALGFYAVLAGLLLAVPLAVWLLVHYGPRRLRAVPVCSALALVALAAVFVFSPYLADSAASSGEGDVIKIYAPWSGLLPGHYIGWLAAVLAAVGLAAPRRRALAGLDGDPRVALVVGALLVAWLVTGGNVWAQRMAEQAGEPPPPALPNLYSLLASVLPGLSAVRGAATPVCALHLVVSLWAGLGLAGLLSFAPARWRTAARAGTVALVWVAVLGVPGVPSAEPFETRAARPSAQTLAFFDALAQKGNRGPILELPIHLHSTDYLAVDSASQTLASAYHRRRTSGCYNAKQPPQMATLENLSQRVPDPEALDALRKMGFTTIVAHRPPGTPFTARLDAAAGPGGRLRRLLSTPEQSAWEIEP